MGLDCERCSESAEKKNKKNKKKNNSMGERESKGPVYICRLFTGETGAFTPDSDKCNVYAMYSAMYMQCIAMYSNVNEWL